MTPNYYKDDSMNKKLAAAKAYLGEKWVLHPAYKPNEKHLKKSIEYK